MTKRVLILATNGFEQSELLEPRQALEDAGIETVLASPEAGSIKGWSEKDWGESVTVDALIADVDSADFDGLLLPGGQMNPDILRMDAHAVQLVKEFGEAGKPVAAICHGPWLLVEAGLVKGRSIAAWPSLKTDLVNAGATYVDQEVSVDGNLITSRKPQDIPAFSKALIAAVNEVVMAG